MGIKTITIDTDIYAVVPRVPTVSNEMKYKFIGEFSWTEETAYYDEDGIEHDSELVHTVPWDLCKTIFKQMAAHWIAATPQPEQAQQSDRMRTRFDEIEREICEGKHTAQSVFTQMRTAATYLQQPTPRPVPTSERLPTEADADGNGAVWWWNSRHSFWAHLQWSTDFLDMEHWTHWQRTELTRPAEPDGGAV